MDTIIKPTISDVINNSWKITKDNIWVLLGLLVGYCIVSGILNFVGGLFNSTIAIIIFNIIMYVFGVIFMLGYMKNCLNAVDKKELNFAAFQQESGKFIQMFVANLIVSILVVIGICLLVIPGLWLAMRLQFCTYFIIEENSGPIKAIQQSWEMTKGEDSYLLIWLLAMIVIVIVGLICLFVGVFVSIVIMYISQAYLFRYFQAAKLAKQTQDTIYPINEI